MKPVKLKLDRLVKSYSYVELSSKLVNFLSVDVLEEMVAGSGGAVQRISSIIYMGTKK